MKLVELTRPDFPFKDIHTAYIRPALTPPTPTQPVKKPTQEELKNEQAARRFFVILRGIGLLFALLLLFAFSFSVGGFIITGLFAAFVIAPKPVSVTITAYLTWLLTHFAGVGVFALTAIPAAVVAVLRQDVWLSLIAVCLVLCLVTAAVTSLAVRLIGNRRPAALDEEDDDLTPAQDIAQRLPEVLVDYYAPLSEYRRPTPLRSLFADEQSWASAVAEQDQLVASERLAAVDDYILSVTDDETEPGVVLVGLAVRRGGRDEELINLAPVLRSQLNVYGIDDYDYDPRYGFVGFRLHTVQLPSEMEKLKTVKTETGFFVNNPSGNLLSWTAGVTAKGEIVRLPLAHTLVFGLTGSGKGSIFRAVLAHLAPYTAQGLARLYMADPKNGEAKAFRKAKCLFEAIETDSSRMADVIDEVYALMKERQQIEDEWEISPENPVIVLLLDEVPSLRKDKVFTGRKDPERENITTNDKLFQILAQGRSDRVIVIGATQYGTKDVLGDIRDNFTIRIALRAERIAQSAYFLNVSEEGLTPIGASTEHNGYATAGIGYVKDDDGTGVQLMRFGFMDNKAFGELAQTYQPEDYGTRKQASLDEAEPEDADAEAVRLALENLS